MQKSAHYRGLWLPLLLLAPQLAVTAVFFLWPAAQALWQSVLRQDPFGLRTRFVGAENFRRLFADPLYLDSLVTTLIFSGAVTVAGLGLGLLFAVQADRVVRGGPAYKTLLILPYAVAPAIAGVLWWFLFHPTVGLAARGLGQLGVAWNHQVNGGQALLLVAAAATWKQVSYNFLFFLAGLQAIPRSLIEAAAIDGAGPWARFRTIVLPLLSPVAFFLLVVNLTYAFFDTFGVIHATTSGGPGQATTTLVYKVYADGVIGLDLGGSAAQSVLLMALVGLLTVVQFRYIERRVAY